MTSRIASSTLILLLLFGTSGAVPARAQDFRHLEDRTPVDPYANQPPVLSPSAVLVPRVLLAGDSWAQYMWDDGSHNDLLDRFGLADQRAVSLSLGSDPGPGYLGPEYAISGSEARQWADTANYPWIENMVEALEANPTIDYVLLSIGGNDVLAGKSGGGWYKDMDLDTPGAEAAFFDQLEEDTFTIIDAALAVRPNLTVILASYDYPNFNVGFWCFVYACPKRQDLARDPGSDPITDQELNAMMVNIEGRRIAWTNGADRVEFDHAAGLMHYWYGDGVTGPLLLPYPGQDPPAYAPFPGGNQLRPTLRANFRRPNGIDADPIHLNFAGYQFKIAGETVTTFFPTFRPPGTGTFFSEGGNRDGWTDGTASGTARIRAGDNGTAPYAGILSFDTSSIPEGAVVTRASLYLQRESLAGTNPFTSGALGLPRIDVVRGTFGMPAVETSDAVAAADAADAGSFVGSVKANGYALRVDLDPDGLLAVNPEGPTQFRVTFAAAGSGTTPDYVAFLDVEAPMPAASGLPTLAGYMGAAAPFLDVQWEVPSGVPETAVGPAAVLRPNSPNPFRYATTLRFSTPVAGQARLDIFDVAGRLVRQLVGGELPPGDHEAVWDGRDGRGARLASGIYLVRLEALDQIRSQRVALVDR